MFRSYDAVISNPWLLSLPTNPPDYGEEPQPEDTMKIGPDPIRVTLAGMAMQGVLAAYADPEEDLPSSGRAAKLAVDYADALIAELNKPTIEDTREAERSHD